MKHAQGHEVSGARFAGFRLLSAVLLLAGGLRAAEEGESLIDLKAPRGGWSFDNGQEFPGATGGLELAPTGGRDSGPALVLKGNFTGGGNYVQASRILAQPIPLQALGFWVRSPGASSFTVRLVDAGGTCHQVDLKLKVTQDWQRILFPAADFFAKMSESRAAGMVAKYEHWGKDNNAGWQGQLKSLHFLLGKTVTPTPTMELCEVKAVAGAPAAEAPVAEVVQTVALDDVLQAGEIDWTFDNGQEFKGAKGSLELVKDQPAPGKNALKLSGDFTGGGAYVQAMRNFDDLVGQTFKSLTLSVRSENCSSITVRLIDGTGQCHQQKGFALKADGQWHDVVIRPEDITGGEHWSGANDGRWHSSAKLVALIMGPGDANKFPAIEFGQVRVSVATAAQVAPPAYREGFESDDSLKTWKTTGAVARTSEQPFAGKGLLQLSRTVETVNQPVSASGPSFPAREGTWEIKGAGRASLHSPDTSYQGVVAVEWLDAGGREVGRGVALEMRGTSVWKPFRQSLQAPKGTASARFLIEQQKTYGTFGVDDLSAAYVQAGASSGQRMVRVMLAPDRLGGLFLPEETPSYKVSVWAAKPLRPEELTATASLADYWGAEISSGTAVALTRIGYKNQAFQYEGRLTLPPAALAVGPFYRLNLDVPVKDAKPFRQTIGVARLPEAATRKLPPESVPFTIRNWDSRITEYFYLADRIGIRMPGIWGGWDNKAPYKPDAPGIDTCQKLGMKWVTGTPAAQVEGGKTEWADPEMLRAGMTNFLKAYATNGLAYIAMGNEPHGGPDQITKNIAAYKAVYEAVKAFDPKIQVIATSVEPNEEYFRQGYYKYCDIYDFHTYESYSGIRKTIAEYNALMKKYNAVKPLFSTELGLNCQGLSRLIVAQEIIKKFAVFFAEGGANASWFTILYPDGDGSMANSSGQAFNVFDCRYNQYNPKLDAVTLYHAVNAFADKKFRAERAYPEGTQAFLFANTAGECLQVVWNDKARADVGLPLPGVAGDATMVLLDGTTVALKPLDGAVAVTASSDPVLILYRASNPTLAAALVPAPLALAAPVSAIVKGRQESFALQGAGLTAQAVRVAAPLNWKVVCSDSGAGRVNCQVTAPAETEAQLGRLVIHRADAAGTRSAIVVELPLVSSFAATLSPFAAAPGQLPGVEIALSNHNREAAPLHWEAEIEGQFGIDKGSFHLTQPEPVTAAFGNVADGTATVPPGGAVTLRLPLRDVDPQTLYRVTVRVRDDLDHEIRVSRLVAGFAAVRRGAPTVDGDLSDLAWATAPAMAINEARQFFSFKNAPWEGPADLSATARFLWDEKNLYVAVDVVDNMFIGTQSDSSLWNQDGLQFLVDPRRAGGEKMGYYDCSLGLGTKGPQVCYHSTASPEVATGLVGDARLAVKRGASGNASYELALPWSRLAPFTPKVGADLGLGLIVNDDDGDGRDFMGWFSGAHLKETDMVGDLVLTE